MAGFLPPPDSALGLLGSCADAAGDVGVMAAAAAVCSH